MGIADPIRTSDLSEQLTADLIDCGSICWCGTSTGAGNSYYLSPYPTFPNRLLLNVYQTGMRYQFVADKTNSGAVQIAIYSNPSSPTLLALKSVTKGAGGSALIAGDIPSGGICTVVDMGTTFRLIDNGTSTGGTTSSTRSFGITLNGGGSVLPTGVAGSSIIPYACTITDWTIISIDNTSGSIVVDVWKKAYASYPPTVADTIAGSEKPTISAAVKGQDLSLSTWTTAVTAGDIIFYNIDSVTSLKLVQLSITATA